MVYKTAVLIIILIFKSGVIGQEMKVDYQIIPHKINLFVGEPLIFTNMLINRTDDTIKMYNWDLFSAGLIPKIKITQPDGTEISIRPSLIGKTIPSDAYVLLNPKDTLTFIRDCYGKVNCHFFFSMSGIYKIRCIFPIYTYPPTKPLPKEKSSIGFNVHSNQVTIHVFPPPKGEEEISKDFVNERIMPEKFISKYPKSIYTPYILYRYLEHLMRQKKYQNAIEICKKLVADFPNFIFSQGLDLTLGYCYHMKGDKTKAKEYYLAFIRKNPKDLMSRVIMNRIKNL